MENQSQSQKGMFVFIGILMYGISAFFCYKGYDKIVNYTNSEYSFIKTVNAYVGGDAYNYIINSNYATGFFVLATMFVIIGTGLIVCGFLSEISSKMNKHENVVLETADIKQEQTEENKEQIKLDEEIDKNS